MYSHKSLFIHYDLTKTSYLLSGPPNINNQYDVINSQAKYSPSNARRMAAIE
jgi:hypothetical protein